MKSLSEIELIALLGGDDDGISMPVCSWPRVPDTPEYNLPPGPGPADPIHDGAPEGEAWYAN